MWIKIFLIVLGLVSLLGGLYVMYQSSAEVVAKNKDVSNEGNELLASNFPLGGIMFLGGSFLAIISGYYLRKELAGDNS